jgi:hypothetical protein
MIDRAEGILFIHIGKQFPAIIMHFKLCKVLNTNLKLAIFA